MEIIFARSESVADVMMRLLHEASTREFEALWAGAGRDDSKESR